MSDARATRVQSFFYVLFCLMIILAGGVFLAGTVRGNDGVDLSAMEQAKEPGNPPPDIETAVLAALDPLEDTAHANVLASYLIWSVQTGKSDAYIDALLNSAAARGHFEIPARFATDDGRLDTPRILQGVMQSTLGSGTDVAALSTEGSGSISGNSGL